MNLNEWNRYVSEFMQHMGRQGVFLTTSACGKTDTMAMSWGSAGIYWQKPVITLPVRFSRYTRELLEKSGYATVSIPGAGTLAKELAFCGVKSGRDVDKFAETGLTLQPGRTVPVPVIAQAKVHFECRVLYKTDMDKLNLDPEIDKVNYAEHNYHTFYFAEVLEFYGA
jgi:flavin reductase (DIM6/NTAB) family NADH-FMN oxidoreductase RutF